MATVNDLTPLAPEAERLRAKLAAGDRPYVTLKAAVTLDGRIATREGSSRWITGEAARRHAHRLRAGHAGILVGRGTVEADDPRLTVRLGEGWPSPARVVLDSLARIDPEARLLADDGVRRLVVVGSEAPARRLAALKERGAEVVACAGARPEPGDYLPRLRAAGIASLLVEGGGTVHGNLIAHREADALFLYVAGCVLGDSAAPAWCGELGMTRLEEAPRLKLAAPLRLGEDVLLHGYFH
jgi:diaminohydroxyphosphoribosylaminopyrimidine deaminase/5-amino-6-(5-phosphoribosylamino)uracil reductase